MVRFMPSSLVRCGWHFIAVNPSRGEDHDRSDVERARRRPSREHRRAGARAAGAARAASPDRVVVRSSGGEDASPLGPGPLPSRTRCRDPLPPSRAASRCPRAAAAGAAVRDEPSPPPPPGPSRRRRSPIRCAETVLRRPGPDGRRRRAGPIPPSRDAAAAGPAESRAWPPSEPGGRAAASELPPALGVAAGAVASRPRRSPSGARPRPPIGAVADAGARPRCRAVAGRAAAAGRSVGRGALGVAARPARSSLIATPVPTEPARTRGDDADLQRRAGAAPPPAPPAPPRRPPRRRPPRFGAVLDQHRSSGSGTSRPSAVAQRLAGAVDRLPRGAAADAQRRGDLLVARALPARASRSPPAGARAAPAGARISSRDLLAALGLLGGAARRRRAPRPAPRPRAAGRAGR